MWAHNISHQEATVAELHTDTLEHQLNILPQSHPLTAFNTENTIIALLKTIIQQV